MNSNSVIFGLESDGKLRVADVAAYLRPLFATVVNTFPSDERTLERVSGEIYRLIDKSMEIDLVQLLDDVLNKKLQSLPPVDGGKIPPELKKEVKKFLLEALDEL